MSDPEQRLYQPGKSVFFGMKNAYLIVFSTPSTCRSTLRLTMGGGELHLWNDWASHVVFKKGQIGLYGGCSIKIWSYHYGINSIYFHKRLTLDEKNKQRRRSGSYR
jgi:hypothetical protein